MKRSGSDAPRLYPGVTNENYSLLYIRSEAMTFLAGGDGCFGPARGCGGMDAAEADGAGGGSTVEAAMGTATAGVGRASVGADDGSTVSAGTEAAAATYGASEGTVVQ